MPSLSRATGKLRGRGQAALRAGGSGRRALSTQASSSPPAAGHRARTHQPRATHGAHPPPGRRPPGEVRPALRQLTPDGVKDTPRSHTWPPEVLAAGRGGSAGEAGGPLAARAPHRVCDVRGLQMTHSSEVVGGRVPQEEGSMNPQSHPKTQGRCLPLWGAHLLTEVTPDAEDSGARLFCQQTLAHVRARRGGGAWACRTRGRGQTPTVPVHRAPEGLESGKPRTSRLPPGAAAPRRPRAARSTRDTRRVPAEVSGRLHEVKRNAENPTGRGLTPAP